jgi:acyl carrier protein
MDLHSEVKKCMIERLDLQLKVAEIPDDEPLFNGGIGLDSIDALDLMIALGKRFKVVIEDDDLKIFESVDKIVEFIRVQQAQAGAATEQA